VVRVDRGLTDLLTCLARWGVVVGAVRGEAAGLQNVQVRDLLTIEGDEPSVCRQLDRCEPAWAEYLTIADQ
jgi:hypothetical protein